MKVVVIGGGPAGMMAAITSAKQGNDVILLEKMKSCGRKLLITGKGRCNITSSLPMDKFIENIPENGKFLYSVFKNFTNQDIITLLKENNVNVKEERGNRIFPLSDRSLDVLQAFENEMKKNNVKIYTETEVKEIKTKDNAVNKVIYLNKRSGIVEEILTEKVILATGGKSYPLTGSTGDGYNIAKELGHTITKISGSLVPLISKNEDLQLCQAMQGLSLRNISMKIVDEEKNKKIYEDFGELLFTHFGVSGPTILSSSAHILRYKNVEELLKKGKIKLQIDLKPALNEEKLNLRLLRDFDKFKNKQIINSLNELLPKKMIEPVIKKAKIKNEKRINEITKQERENLIRVIKCFEITISGFRPIEEAIITRGGINVKEINPKTMESKLIEGLYFAGEIIDVDAYTGGFNLQIAYSTGYTAGLNSN
ncbi:MAG: NAD(P)/FAD-dependent oxidoreductase [Clostridia bacterium]|jgi:predicted Rossmann fold flavoprotein|uniref:NAD(P)/FAD-dependent oxidoreductase n=1 Tax=Candidatus Merdicola sp. TaxID=3085652 RepID=UPI002FA77204